MRLLQSDPVASARMQLARFLRHIDGVRGIYRLQRLIASPSLLVRHRQVVDVPYPFTPAGSTGTPVSWRGHTGEFIGWNAWYSGHYELETLGIMDALIQKGHVAAEIGANRGYHTIFAGMCVGPTGRVFAFEPNPGPRSTLQENVTRLGWSARVQIRDCALGAKPGEAEFFVPLASVENQGVGGFTNNSTLPTEKIEVSVSTLDEQIAGGACDFVKMDVQGAEAEVLRGATETIRRCGPRVYFEVELGEAGGHEAADILRQAGYTVWRVQGTRRPPYVVLHPLPRHRDWRSNCIALLPAHTEATRLPRAVHG